MQFAVIEGLDGSGKSTQVNKLRKYLEEKKIKYRYLHFPRTDSPFYGEMIARFLRGEFGENDAVDPYLVALLYAGDRAAAADTIRKWIADGYFVLLDRYVFSNIAFQCAKLSKQEDKEKLKSWILELEYQHHALPKPDKSLFLDVPFTFTKSKLSKTREGDDRSYLKGSKDIHEEHLDFQELVREIYLWQVEEHDDFIKIDCNDLEGNMLSPEKIFTMVINELDFS